MDEKKEISHIIDVIQQAKTALKEKDALKLKELSDQTAHASSVFQKDRYINIAVLLYALNKIVQRRHDYHIKDWPGFVKKVDKTFSDAIDALEKEKLGVCDKCLDRTKKAIESISKDLKPHMEELLRKAAINKAIKIHEHGPSKEKTAKLLGISQWELNEYAGQKMGKTDAKLSTTINTKQRVKMAMEFFT